MAAPGYGRGFDLTLHADRLGQPLERKKPTIYFVGSMADLFHEEVPDAFVERVLAVARQTPRHTYLLLTKRTERLAGAERGAVVGGGDRGFQSGWTGSGPRIQSSIFSSGIRS
jgi:protein gp37